MSEIDLTTATETAKIPCLWKLVQLGASVPNFLGKDAATTEMRTTFFKAGRDIPALAPNLIAKTSVIPHDQEDIMAASMTAPTFNAKHAGYTGSMRADVLSALIAIAFCFPFVVAGRAYKLSLAHFTATIRSAKEIDLSKSPFWFNFSTSDAPENLDMLRYYINVAISYCNMKVAPRSPSLSTVPPPRPPSARPLACPLRPVASTR